MPPTIEQVIAAIPDWAGRNVTAERIPAGLTNTNWRVVVDGTPFFVRIPGADTELLAVDRGNEIHNTIAAAKAGVAPRVVQTVPEWDVFVLEWLDARTMSNESLRADGMPSRIAGVLRRLHAGPRFRDEFDMFRVSERYMALVDERSIQVPSGYREHLALIPRIEVALGVQRPTPVPCHNDLLAENYLDDGERLWLVDWELAFRNDPVADVANIANNFSAVPDVDTLVLEGWLGRSPDDDIRRRLALMRDLQRLFFGCLLLSEFLGRRDPEPELVAMTPDEFRAAIMRSELRGTPELLFVLGRMNLAGFTAAHGS